MTLSFPAATLTDSVPPGRAEFIREWYSLYARPNTRIYVGGETWMLRSIALDPSLRVFAGAGLFDSMKSCAGNEASLVRHRPGSRTRQHQVVSKLAAQRAMKEANQST